MKENHDSRLRNLEDFAAIASDWFWETDHEHRFCYLSGRVETVIKVPASDVLGTRRTDLGIDQQEDPAWQAHVKDLNAHVPFKNFEYSYKRRIDGVVVRLRVSGSPFFDDTGKFLGYRGTANDITNEYEAMNSLKQSNAELAARNEELIDMRRALERSMSEDSLTGLLNRRAFEHDLQETLGVAGNKVILIYINLDRFKWVNDTLGYLVGDSVLKLVTERLRHLASGQGPVYRVGGDEFQIVLADNADLERARWIADTVLEVLAAPICTDSGQEIAVNASIGIAFGVGQDIAPRQLISNADIALGEAKKGGRGCVRELDSSMLDAIAAKRQLAREIPRAIAENEVIPYFQPQIDVRTGQLIGTEALARWHHPRLGILGPGAFLDIAAQLGLLAAIDRSMMHQSLAYVATLADDGLCLPSISVNLSAGRLIDPHLVKDIETSWQDRRCKLTVELLETISFDELRKDPIASANLQQLRDMGVQIETDDFGSGSASITSLLEIQPDRVKIDRHLIQAAVHDPAKRKVVTAILDMTHALGIEALAEGVETDKDIAIIAELGCDLFQGYAYARPMPQEDFKEYLQMSAGGPKTQTAGPASLPKRA